MHSMYFKQAESNSAAEHFQPTEQQENGVNELKNSFIHPSIDSLGDTPSYNQEFDMLSEGLW